MRKIPENHAKYEFWFNDKALYSVGSDVGYGGKQALFDNDLTSFWHSSDCTKGANRCSITIQFLVKYFKFRLNSRKIHNFSFISQNWHFWGNNKKWWILKSPRNSSFLWFSISHDILSSKMNVLRIQPNLIVLCF